MSEAEGGARAATPSPQNAPTKARAAEARDIGKEAREILEQSNAWQAMTANLSLKWENNTVVCEDALAPTSYARLFHLVKTVLQPRYNVSGTGYGRFVAVISEA